MPDGTKVTVGDNGDVTVTYPDGSKDTITGNKVVEGKTDTEKNSDTDLINAKAGNTPDVPRSVEIKKGDEAPAGIVVAKDKDDKDTTFPEGTKVTWETAPDVTKNGPATGKVTVTYPDKTTDTVDVTVNVVPSDADKNEPNVPSEDDKVKVDDPTKLTDTEKGDVVKAVEDANKDEDGKSTLPEGSKVTVGDNGDVTVTYPDGSKDTITGNKVVEGKTDTEKNSDTDLINAKAGNTPDVPRSVEIKKGDEAPAGIVVAKDKDDKDTTFPEGTKVTWETAPDVTKNGPATGKVTVTYPDKTTDTVDVTVNVVPSDADKNEPNVPSEDDKVKVDDPTKLTDTEKGDVVKAVEDANKDEDGKSTLPEGSKVTVGDNGDVTVTYPDGSKDTITGNKVVEGKTDTEKNSDTDLINAKAGNTPDVPRSVEIKKGDEAPAGIVVAKDKDDKDTTFPEGTKVTWETAPDVTKNGPATGKVTVTYPDKTTDTVDVTVNVVPSDADKNEPNVPSEDDKVKVDDPTKLTDTEKGDVVKAVEDANKDEDGKSTLPEGSKVTVGDNGDVTVTYPDGSKDTITGNKVVEGKTDTEKNSDTDLINAKAGNTPDVPRSVEIKKGDEAPAGIVVAKDKDDKDTTFPEGTKVTWETAPDVTKNGPATGKVTVTYPDKTTDTVDVTVNVVPSDADKNEPNVPSEDDKVKVDDPTKLTDTEKGDVVKAVEDANKDEDGKSTLPEGSKVTVGDNGDVTVTYPDGSKDTITGNKVVEGKTDTEKNSDTDLINAKAGNTPDVPRSVEIKKGDEAPAGIVVAKDKDDKDTTFPEGTKVTWETAPDVTKNGPATGKVTVTYPDKTTDTVDVTVNVVPSDADKNEPNVPSEDDKVKVDDPTKLTDTEKGDVVKAVEDANKDEDGKSTLPEGSKVTVGDNGDVTVTYPDGSKDTITGNKVVEGKTDTEKNSDTDLINAKAGNTPDVPRSVEIKKGDEAPAGIVVAKDKDDKDTTFPEGTKVTWETAPDVTKNGPATGKVTVTYPDKTTDTVDVTVNVVPSDADKNEPNVPSEDDKVKVDDPTKLTDTEKGDVVKAVEDANKDDNGNSTLPDGTKVTVGDNGDVTVTYPDGSKDTITGNKVVEGKDNGGETGDQTDAKKNNPAVPGDKVRVDDPAKLTDDEKEDVVKAVEDANKDDNGNSTLPDGTKITVGDNGDVTVTYPDGSKDTITGDKVVEGKTDADKNEPNVPSEDDKMKVDDPTKLTDNEKNAVKDKVDEANPNLPDGTKITVGDDGTTTIMYPDGSTNTIPGHDLVTGKTDADKYPLNPGQAVDVVDPNHLTQAEQDQVKEAIRTANPTAPISTITVDAAENVQVTFADGSTTTLQANLHKHVTEATTGSATKPGAGTNGGQTKGAMATNQTATKQQAQQHLPQTGDQPATWAMLSGLGVAFLGLLGLKKKRED